LLGAHNASVTVSTHGGPAKLLGYSLHLEGNQKREIVPKHPLLPLLDARRITVEYRCFPAIR
jgi:hypothetical protein